MSRVSMSTEELKNFTGEVVEEKLKEILGDSEYDLELKEEVKQRLKRTFEGEEKGERGIPAKKIC